MRRYIAISFAALMLLAGCASVGRDFPFDRINEIKPGVSTKADVSAILGKPMSRNAMADGQEYWGYLHSTKKPFSDVESKSYTVFFDADGVVKKMPGAPPSTR